MYFQSDESMNFLVEKYESTRKQTMIQLGSAEKLARVQKRAIIRIWAEQKAASDKAAEVQEIVQVKFEELKGTLTSSQAARKEMSREKSTLKKEKDVLEREKAALER